MGNKVRDLYRLLLSKNKYDTESKMAISHRMLSCIRREEEQLDDNLFLKVDNLEDSNNMNIVVWSNIDLPHGQKAKNVRNFTDEEFLEFILELTKKEEKKKSGNSGLSM